MNTDSNFSIQFENFTVGFGRLPVVEDLNLKIINGERFCILGPSGGGKTTLLNCIAGIIDYNPNSFRRGRVSIEGIEDRELGNRKGSVGYVFQDLALFPNMNVWQNIAFPLQVKKYPKDIISVKVERMLQILQLEQKRNSLISALSGGQKQRVALGRALVLEPNILCMDEPLKGLDPILKKVFLEKLIELHSEFKFTLVYVTHDREEAYFCSDRIAILDDCKILQVDTPRNLYDRPQNLQVAMFTGNVNAIEDQEFMNSMELVDFAKERLGAHEKWNGKIMFRPEHCRMESLISNSDFIFQDNKLIFSGTVIASQFMGKFFQNAISFKGSHIYFEGGKIDTEKRVSISVVLDKLIFY